MAEGAATAATFLFTDIEGSTRLLKRLREGYPGVLEVHRDLLRAAFATHGGREVDTQGDAFFVAFPRARDAVLAAADAQRALDGHAWPDDITVRVRVGIHTGEATVDQDRYVGLSVHRAARICALARGGQILISQTTRHMLEDAEDDLPGLELRDLGERSLKDLDHAVRLAEVVWSGVMPPPTAAPLEAAGILRTLPGPLGLVPSSPFVGRSAELASLREALPLTPELGRQLALVSGEPGSGKTRLVRELAQEAAAGGFAVLYGASDAVVNAPYQPFVEVLDILLRTLDDESVRRSARVAGPELARLVPDLATRVGAVSAPPDADPDTARHRLHVAVADVLLEASRMRPLVIVLDDLHWADGPTLHLVRHLARAGEIRMLLLATFREREAGERLELADTLSDVARVGNVTRLRLEPLSGSAVEDFVRRSSGADREADVAGAAEAFGELTGGNAFLLCELWRTLLEAGTVEVSETEVRLGRPLGELSSPESVRDVVTFRLARLGAATTALLETGAVGGTVVSTDILRRAVDLDDPEFTAALDEAARSGTLEEVPGTGLTYRFTHELVRRALVDRLTAIRRAELHLRVGRALEDAHGSNPSGVISELAHHFTAALPVGDGERAVRYSIAAADAARSSLAYEDAARHLATALLLGVPDDAERARLQLELGTAYDRAGQTPEALEAFRRAAEIARARGDAATLARAALGHETAANQPMATTEESVRLLREAIATLGDGDSALRAQVYSALSRALVFVGEHDESARLRLEATDMARRLGDRSTLARILIQVESRNVRMAPEEMLERLTEARDLAAELGDSYVLLEAMWRRIPLLVAMGDLHAARRDVEEYHRTADRGGEPIKIHTAELFGSALALGDGRLDEAEAMAERAEEWARLLRFPPSGEYGVQLFGIRREQGRLSELEPVIQLLAASHDTWRPGLVALLVEIGMADEARTELHRLAQGGFSGITSDLSTASLVYLAEACTALGDRDSAAVLYPLLEPLATRTVQIGHLVAFNGAADRYLGMLAGVLGAWDDAEAHFEYALYLNRRMSAHTWTAHTAYEYAVMLLARARTFDGERTLELLREADAIADRHGLARLRVKVAALRGEPARQPELPDELSPRELVVLRLVARGLSNREIGRELVISEHTAANHVRSILRKTGCANRTDAASYAHRHGLVAEH